MIEGKPLVFISHSEKAKKTLAIPFRNHLESLGLHGVIVGDEPMPDKSISGPAEKVAYFLDHSSMFVGLASPDEKLASGGVRTRQNIIHEIGSALERPNLRDRVQVFKAPTVELPSNINLVHERLDPADITSVFSTFETQAREWGVLPKQPVPSGPTEPSPASADAALDPSGGDAAALAQAITALDGVGQLIRGEDLENAAAISARAFLAASANLAGRWSVQLLGAHELNALYQDREAVKPTEQELAHLLKTVVAGIGAANAPGWYWLRGLDASQIQQRIVLMASTEGNSSASRAAAGLIAKSPVTLTPGELRTIVRSALREGSDRSAAGLKLLGRIGTRNDLRALAGTLDTFSDSKAVRGAQLHVQARESPSHALQLLLEDPAQLDPKIEHHLLKAAKSLPRIRIDRAVESTSPEMRRLGLRLLNATSQLQKNDVVRIITGDADSEVRLLAAEIALRRKWQISAATVEAATADTSLFSYDRRRSIEAGFVRLQSINELSEQLEWYGTRSYFVYQALGENDFSLLEGRIEDDLENDFQALKDLSRARFVERIRDAAEREFAAKFGDIDATRRAQIEEMTEERLTEYLSGWGKVDDFLLEQFRVAALRSLVANPHASYAKFARSFLTSKDATLVSLSIELLAHAGAASDVPKLIEMAASSPPSVSAARAAVSLSDDPIDTASKLLAIENAEIAAVALGPFEDRQVDGAVIHSLWPLLRSESLAVRDSVVDFFIGRLDASELNVLLNIYQGEGQHYYSVVARIDRAIHAPGWVRSGANSILT